MGTQIPFLSQPGVWDPGGSALAVLDIGRLSEEVSCKWLSWRVKTVELLRKLICASFERSGMSDFTVCGCATALEGLFTKRSSAGRRIWTKGELNGLSDWHAFSACFLIHDDRTDALDLDIGLNLTCNDDFNCGATTILMTGFPFSRPLARRQRFWQDFGASLLHPAIFA